MKASITRENLPAILLVLAATSYAWGEGAYDLTYSTYFGGGAWEHARDIFVDAGGNVYVCGGTASRDFPVTPGACDPTFNFGDTSGQECDAFVCKFAPNGQLIWSTYLGGPGYDRAYGIEVDGQGCVYVAGRAGREFPTTPEAFQPTFQGYDGGGYGGYQNGFVAKLSPDGTRLLWASYVGVAQLCRDIAIDAAGDVYLPLGYPDKGALPPDGWFAHAFQKTPGGGMDCGVIKVSGDGTKVLWATWLGGSGNENNAASIRVGPAGKVYVAGSTASTDFPTTPGAYDTTFNGGTDYFVACLTPDGSDLVYATFLGGAGGEAISTHNLAIDDRGNAYVALQTSSTGFPTTAGAMQARFGGGGTDMAVAKFSPTGALLAATYLGGNAAENADGVYVDPDGNVLITGDTQSTNFRVTPDARQPESRGGGEAVVALLAADFSHLLYATYLGGPSNDNGRAGFLGRDGSLYVTGSSDGPGWPVRNEYQSTFKGGAGDWGSGDCVLARLSPAGTITLDPSKTYQTISGWEAVAFALEPSDPAFPNFRDPLIELAVNDLGINRVRLEIRSGVENTDDNWSAYQGGAIDYQTWRSRRYATINDNTDPCSIDWSGFHFSEMDNTIDRLVNPLRAALAAKGEKLIVNVNYVAFTGQITSGVYLHNDPAEYAEFVLATYLHLQEKYGWTPDLWEVLLEPDNVSQWNGRLLGEAIVATAQRLREAGFEPAFVAPSNTNMGNAVRDFDQMIQVPGVLAVLREFSYHRYGGVSPENLRAIVTRARQHGIDTAMLEWWSNGNGYPTLHEDLKIGNNSAWEQGVLGGDLNAPTALCVIDRTDPAHPKVLLGGKTKFLRQYYKFVRPGATRVEAVSQVAFLDPLAFINVDGGYVVVVKCDVGGQFSVGSLAAGTYGIKYTTADAFDVDLPDQTIDAGQPLVAAIPQPGVLTVYARPPAFDQEPPTAPTDLAASAVSPAQVTVVWAASTDNIAVAGYKIYRDGTQVGFSPGTSFEDTKAEAGASYIYEVLAYDTAGNESSLSEPLTVVMPLSNIGSDVIGYWKFDEGQGASAGDSSIYRHHGVIVGAAWAQGYTGQALNFDGIGDYVQIQATPVLDNLEALTMAAWIYPLVDAHWHILDKGDGDKRIYAEGTTRTLDGRIRYEGAHGYARSLAGTLRLNEWQHLAMTWSRTTNLTRLYHDGVEVRYAAQDIGTGSPLDDATHPYIIGARGNLAEVTFFNGLIDEVRLYRRALSSGEINDLYDFPTNRR